MSTFSDNLKKLREKTGKQSKEFSKEVGIQYTTYANYEQGRSEPKLDNLIKIATCLKVSIDDLLGYRLNEYEYYSKLITDMGYNISLNADNTVTVKAPHNLGQFYIANTNIVTLPSKQEFVKLLKYAFAQSEFITISINEDTVSRAFLECSLGLPPRKEYDENDDEFDAEEFIKEFREKHKKEQLPLEDNQSSEGDRLEKPTSEAKKIPSMSKDTKG